MMSFIRAAGAGIKPSQVDMVEEAVMARKFIDCREVPSEMNCMVAISADTEAELMQAAIQHAVAVHGHKDTEELRETIRRAMHTGTSPENSPARSV